MTQQRLQLRAAAVVACDIVYQEPSPSVSPGGNSLRPGAAAAAPSAAARPGASPRGQISSRTLPAATTASSSQAGSVRASSSSAHGRHVQALPVHLDFDARSSLPLPHHNRHPQKQQKQQQLPPPPPPRGRGVATYTLCVTLASPGHNGGDGFGEESSYRVEKQHAEFGSLYFALQSYSTAIACMAHSAATPVPAYPWQLQLPPVNDGAVLSPSSRAALAHNNTALTAWLQALIDDSSLRESIVLRDWLDVPPDPLFDARDDEAWLCDSGGRELDETNFIFFNDEEAEAGGEGDASSVAAQQQQDGEWVEDPDAANAATSAGEDCEDASGLLLMASPEVDVESPLAATAAAAPSPSRRVGVQSFQLLRVIGKGSFASVMLVRKIDSRRLYAMKVLEKAAVVARRQVDHTRTERNVLACIRHPFIVPLRFAFQSRSKLFLVLDFVRGGELFHHLGLSGRFTESRARFYAAQIVLALEHLHARSIIYRDLKPENLLIDADGYLKIADFGLAKEHISDSSLTHSFCGTAEYLAPEIVSRAGHGRAVDYWSLGCLLYEMLVGCPPFFSRSRDRLFEKILRADLVLPEELSPEAQDLLAALLERDPARRLGSAIEDGAEVRAHPFFASVDWQAMLDKRVVPEWKPTIKQSESGARQQQQRQPTAAHGAVSKTASSIKPVSSHEVTPSSVSAASGAVADANDINSSIGADDMLLFSCPDTSNFDKAFTSLPLLDLQSSLPSVGPDPALAGTAAAAAATAAAATPAEAAAAAAAAQDKEEEDALAAQFNGFSYTSPEAEFASPPLSPVAGAGAGAVADLEGHPPAASSIPVPVQRVASSQHGHFFGSGSNAAQTASRPAIRTQHHHAAANNCSAAVPHAYGSPWRDFSAMHFRR